MTIEFALMASSVARKPIPARYVQVLRVTALLFCLMPAGGSGAHTDTGTVYVFPFTDLSPRALQKMMIAAMPGVNVTVFGHVGDFQRRLRSDTPDAAIAPAPVLEVFGQTVELQGTMGHTTKEPYVLLSEQMLDTETLASKTIGCVDLVGRANLPEFVGGVLKLNVTPKVQRVPKVEDLLQLLRFRKADAVLLPERLLSGLRARTKMDLQELKVAGAEVARTAIAFPGNRARVEAALRKLPSGVMSKLGLDGWK